VDKVVARLTAGGKLFHIANSSFVKEKKKKDLKVISYE